MIEVDYLNHMGSDLSVVNAARVSFHKESEWEHSVCECAARSENECCCGAWSEALDTLKKRDEKLINFLARNSHWTPFGHTAISVRVRAPVFVRTQCFKHKVGFVENEVSRRYVKEDPEFFIPESWRSAPKNAKQGSGEELCEEDQKELNEFAKSVFNMSNTFYQELLHDYNLSPEQARMFLPQAMMTEWWWTGSVASFARMYNLRIDSHAQYEVRLVAEQVDKIVRPLFPVSWEALTHGESM